MQMGMKGNRTDVGLRNRLKFYVKSIDHRVGKKKSRESDD